MDNVYLVGKAPEYGVEHIGYLRDVVTGTIVTVTVPALTKVVIISDELVMAKTVTPIGMWDDEVLYMTLEPGSQPVRVKNNQPLWTEIGWYSVCKGKTAWRDSGPPYIVKVRREYHTYLKSFNTLEAARTACGKLAELAGIRLEILDSSGNSHNTGGRYVGK